MKNFTLLILLTLLFYPGVFAQRNFFQPINTGQLPQAREVIKQVRNKGVYKLDEKAMRSYLLKAPMEFKNNGITLPLEIPLPDGKTEIFNIVESPVLSPNIAADHPEIKTYTGNGQNDKKAVIRISFTSDGFNAVIFNLDGDAVYFELYSKSQRDVYFNYFVRDLIVPDGDLKKKSCNVELNAQELSQQSAINKTSSQQSEQLTSSTGGTLTTYRLAMPADAEFVAHHGGTVTSGFNAVVTYVNRINAFFRNELSVAFTLVSGSNMIYTDPATDPYNNSDQVAMLDQNITNCNTVLGYSNYDIGHVWGYAGGSGGGVASLRSLCNDFQKGRGVSGEGDLAQYSQVFMDQLVFHEMGHQFGMTHSYNSTVPVCTTREPSTSVEPGAGATVMSYGFTCGSDDYYQTPAPRTGPILAFHATSYAQAIAFISTLSCGTVTSTGNTPPVITLPPNYTIPKSTPFALTGSATDANGDALTYSWEGTNIGTTTPNATTLANTAQPPFFRSYSPVTIPTRIYPSIETILSGSNYSKGDKLPSVGIVTTHQFTVRDNNALGGGISSGSVSVTIDGNTGPFLETTNLSGTYAGLSNQTITWSVNGTNTATPNVKISLSTDGGYTFATTLLASTPNDGSESVTLPNITTTTARIKVEAVGNIFFDISNSNFSINPSAGAFNITAGAGTNGFISPNGTVSVPSGANQTFNITADACYKIASVLVDGVSVGAIPSYTFSNVTTTHSINASFSQITYPITASAGANGSITPGGVTSINCGSSQTYNITPNAGYSIQDVVVDGVSQGAINSRTFTNVSAAHSITASFVSSGSTVVYRINAGGGQVNSSIGVFAADAYYSPSPGNTSSTTAAIAGTTDDAVYQTDRYGSTGVLNYTFPVTNGQYVVVLHFAEIYFAAVNNRVFDVSLESTKVLDNYDIFKKVGANTATTETFPINVADGTLNIYFSSLATDGGANNPKVSAIEILRNSASNTAPIANAGADRTITLPVSSTTLNGSGTDVDGTIASYSWTQVSGPNAAVFDNSSIAAPTVSGLVAGYYLFNLVVMDNQSAASAADQVLVTVNASGNTVVYRINAGGGQVTNSIGVFEADAYYSPTPGNTSSTTADIAGTTDDAIYQSDRYGGTGVLNYAFPVTNGQYTVILHFAEIYFTAFNNRVFDVSLEGVKVLDNYDIFRKVGANTATTETFPVNVADGTLNIYFSSLVADGGANNPKVSAIEIIKSGTGNNAPVADAGADKIITLPVNSTTLNGSGTDADGTITSYAWTQVSGPNSATFSSNSVAAPTVSNLIAGSYIFSLVVTDNQFAASAADQVSVTVNPGGNTVVYRINAGGGQVTNSIGVFASDAYYSPSPGNTSSTAADISGTTDDAIYQTDRYSSTKTLNYDFPVANGQYTVVLHFAEIYYTGQNNRIFDVSIEGNKVLDNYDILKKVAAYTATTETFTANVADGTLNIYFSSLQADGGANNPKISAIEIIKIGSMQAPDPQAIFKTKVVITDTTSTRLLQNFTVRVNPNPAYDHFTFHTTSVNNKTLSLRIFSADGKLMESRKNLVSNGTLDIGGRYLPGLYYAEVLQGNERIILKFIKLSR